MRSIVFASGKGGVGKTSVALNMGLLLSQAGKKTVVIDADLDMANITILLGVELNPITLHNVLAGENNIADAVYEGPSKLYYVPASLNEDRKTLDYDKLRAAVTELEKTYDYLFIDCPPGLKEEAQSAMLSAQEVVIIVNPEPTSVIDSLKVKRFAEKNGLKLTGVIINRATNDKTELTPKDVQSVLHVPVLGVLPEDAEVRRSTLLQTPITIRSPNAPFTRALKTLAKNLTHENIQEQAIKSSLLQKIKELISNILRKK